MDMKVGHFLPATKAVPKELLPIVDVEGAALQRTPEADAAPPEELVEAAPAGR